MKNNKKQKKILSYKEVKKFLDVEDKDLLYSIKHKQIPCFIEGRCFKFHFAKLVTWLGGEKLPTTQLMVVK